MYSYLLAFVLLFVSFMPAYAGCPNGQCSRPAPVRATVTFSKSFVKKVVPKRPLRRLFR